MPQPRKLTDEQEQKVAEKYQQGISLEKLSRIHRCDVKTIKRLLERQGIKRRNMLGGRCDYYRPSLQEIQEEAAKIRQGWTEEEHWARAGVSREPYTIPMTEFIGTERQGVTV